MVKENHFKPIKSDQMNAREFFYLVSQMRQAQRDYFADREQSALRKCKVLEKEVDDEIYRVKEVLAEKEKDQV